ncbi:MAG TPA: alpha-1,4-glucan--maltose-1-phosphate maltosyltransferase [Steroidobacteraceae bacterium]|nr:alpha-1,4-glucan--maltose-1-phosphate maltosyltransferase [Steroidobacteraceae bacterium]
MSAPVPSPVDGRVRVVIENVAPQIDCGRFAVKRTAGESLAVEADVFADGHDAVSCIVLHRRAGAKDWQRIAMTALGNDRWRASFRVNDLGRHEYTVAGWVDHLETWRRDLIKRYEAGQDLTVDFERGVQLARELATRVSRLEQRRLEEWASALTQLTGEAVERVALAQSETIRAIALAHPDPSLVRQHEPILSVEVDRERARFSAWYELFPRSTARVTGKHGTFADVIARLPYVAAMGFDVLYLPPIHPIGLAYRKAPNNRTTAAKGDPGSPWAIGGKEGGHKAVHPELGTPEDFRKLVARAGELGLEIALDVAFQTSPDHPYVREHPEWFQHRPDGTIQYAENPPKKYQDIYPFDFESDAWRALWEELASIVEHWIGEGVRIFRVDNPHTKPFAMWEWLIARVKRRNPEAIFLSEAFTRPKVMYRLAKAGFSQSYNYFPWRNAKREIIEYFRELTTPPVSEFFRASLWPNTPDILTEYLQYGGRPAFMSRVALAATLGASYGIYGPAYELLEHRAREPGGEEYLDAEKYQLRHWDLERPDSLRDYITRLNRIRRENPPLQSDRGLAFHGVDNDSLIAYSKRAEDGGDSLLMVVNLDPHHTQAGWLELDLTALGLTAEAAFQAHDLLSDARYLWRGARNYIALDPRHSPAHLFGIRRRVRSEHDFDYFL